MKINKKFLKLSYMYAENSNDDYKGYKEVATQEDFDKF